MNQSLLKKLRPHLLVLGVFLLISLSYCYPVLQGKVMNQSDDITARALTAEGEEYYKKTKEHVSWTTRMFSGMPTSYGGGAGIGNISYQLVYVLANWLNGFSFDVILWCLLGMYILLVLLGLEIKLAALGAFIFAFSSFSMLSLETGHVQKMFNFAFVPILLGGVYLVYKGKYTWGFILTALGVNYQIVIGHYQVTYYAMLACVCMAAFYSVRLIIDKNYKHFGKSVGILAIACVLGTLPNLGLVSNYYSSYETTRGGKSELTAKTTEDTNQDGSLDFAYATQWSYGIGETFTILVPDVYGGDGGRMFEKIQEGETLAAFRQLQAQQVSQELLTQYNRSMSSYWGDQPFVGGPMYFGAIVCFLFVLGLLVYKGPEKWWLLIITVFFLTLAWGRNSAIYTFFFNNIPVFNKFRTPSMALGIVQIGFSALAAMAIYSLTRMEITDKLKKQFYIAAGIVGGLLVLFYITPGTFFSFQSANKNEDKLPEILQDGLMSDRMALMKADTLRSLFFVVVAVALVWLYLTKKIKANILVWGLALAIVIDLWSFNRRYLNAESFVSRSRHKQQTAPSPADMLIKQQDNSLHYRVFNLSVGNPFSDAMTSYHHRSVGGYHGAKLRKYQELIEHQLNTINPAVLSMLDTRYIIRDAKQPAVIPNPDACGAAWFVPSIKWVDNGDQEMAALSVSNDSGAYSFDPKKAVIIQKKNGEGLQNFNPQLDPNGKIELVNYNPNHAEYKTSAATEQMAVFSEIHYLQPDGDGWKAYVDGKETPYHRVNYVLRGMKVPAGNHTIEFRYDLSQAKMRNNIGFFMLVLLVGVSGFFIYRELKPKAVRS